MILVMSGWYLVPVEHQSATVNNVFNRVKDDDFVSKHKISDKKAYHIALLVTSSLAHVTIPSAVSVSKKDNDIPLSAEWLALGSKRRPHHHCESIDSSWFRRMTTRTGDREEVRVNRPAPPIDFTEMSSKGGLLATRKALCRSKSLKHHDVRNTTATHSDYHYGA